MALPFGRGEHVAVAGLSADATVVADLPGTGLVALARRAPVARGGSHADDYLTLFDAEAAPATCSSPRPSWQRGARASWPARGSAPPQRSSGCATGSSADALTHVKARRQFGQALAEFQAVQHLLAWAATELHQLRCLFDIAVLSAAEGTPDPALAETVKAVAGRVLHASRRRAIQVTGAISFTWEYSLNRLHHRGLLLDQVAGSSAELVDDGRRAHPDRAAARPARRAVGPGRLKAVQRLRIAVIGPRT